LGSLSGIALNVPVGKMYWCNWTDGVIHRANMEIPPGETPENRTDIEDVVTGLSYPNEIALDLVHGMMYWADTDQMKIQRATLDGQNVQDIVIVDEGLPTGIALDVPLGSIPTLSQWGLAAMVLLILIAGTIVFVRRPAFEIER
jgi:sugar lactone lactonase YvrE